MNWLTKLNLNNYEFCKNDRRFISFVGFLCLFCWWLNPLVQQSRYKNNCIRTLSKAVVVKSDISKYSEFLSKSNLNEADLAEATAYMDCSNGKTYF